MIADNTLRSRSYMIPEQENSKKRKKLKETNLKKKNNKIRKKKSGEIKKILNVKNLGKPQK